MPAPVIIVDADGLIALISKNDLHHKNAQTYISFLTDKHAEVYFPTLTIAEAMTTFKRKLNNPKDCEILINNVVSRNFSLIPITEEHIYKSLEYFNPHDSKQNTFFDAIIAHLANEYNADAIFSFDKWYKRKGFTLIEDLF